MKEVLIKILEVIKKEKIRINQGRENNWDMKQYDIGVSVVLFESGLRLLKNVS